MSKKETWQDFVDFCPLRSELQKAIKFHGLEKFEKQIIESSKPSQRIVLAPSLDKTAISHFGGEPLAPSSFDWPMTRRGRPLSFLCQIDLGEFSFWAEKNHLPPEGSLAFFYDFKQMSWGIRSDEDDSWRVYFFDEEENLIDIPNPLALHESFVLPRSSLRYQEELTIPDLRDVLVEANKIFQGDNYKRLFKAWSLEDRTSKNRLLGYPDLINYDARRDCHIAFNNINLEESDIFDERKSNSLDEESKNWELLLQIDSDRKYGVNFESTGTVYFFLEKEDLLGRHFSNTWLTLQSHH